MTLFKNLVLLALLVTATAHGDALGDAIALYESGNRAAAARALDTLDRRQPQVAYYLGRIAFDERRWKRALDHFEAAVEGDGDNDRYWLWIGNTAGIWAGDVNMFKAAGLARTSRKAFEKAIELNPSNLDARTGLITFHLNAPGFVGGDRDQARAEVEAIRSIEPRLAYRQEARVHLAEDETEQAMATLEKGLEAFPGDPGLSVTLAVLLHQQEDYARAHGVLKPLAEAEEPDFGVLYQLGRTGALSGRYLDDAREAMLRYIELSNDGPVPIPVSSAWWRLGMIHEHGDQPQDALRCYETALEIDPDDENAAAAMKQLQRRL